jgi:hypothetical protein
MHDDLHARRVIAALQQLGEAASHDDVADDDLDTAVAAALAVPGVGEELKRRAQELARCVAGDLESEPA